MAPEIIEVSSSRCFNGYQKVFSHKSEVLHCLMKFGIYIPSQAENNKVPLLYYLSGLTCTEQNFIQKSGFQKFASRYGFIVVSPDTSPRGEDIPDEPKWNIGAGAGHYINATQEPWSTNYQMYSYITEELPAIIEENFPILPDKQSIMGHSMGGSGALICKFHHPEKYKSVSLFAPVCDATRTPPMVEAYTAYLGGSPDNGTWDKWSGTKLMKNYTGPKFEILLDQGTADEFLHALYTEDFVKACKEAEMPITCNMREGYDHGYYFISTFIEDHFKHHAKYLL